jgi:hypothetical protein
MRHLLCSRRRIALAGKYRGQGRLWLDFRLQLLSYIASQGGAPV